jgi:ATP-binding cassette, subfamily C, bacterial CydD
MPPDSDQFHAAHPPEGSAPLHWLAAQSRHARLLLRTVYVTALLDTALAVAQAALLAWLAAQLINGSTSLWQPAWLLLLVLTVRTLNSALRARQGAGAAADISRAVRDEVVAALLRGQGAALTPGEASTALLEQSDAVGRYHAGFATQRRIAAMATLLFLVAAFSTDWIVGLILLLTAPLIPLFMILVGTGAQRAADRQLDSLRFLGGYFLDRLRGVLTLRAFAREQAEQHAVQVSTDDFRRRTMKVLRIAFLTSAVLELFAALAVALVALYVGLHLLNLIAIGPGPALHFGTGLFLLLLAPEFYQPLRQLAAGYHERAAARAAADVLAPLLATPVMPPDTSTAPIIRQAPSVTLANVHFRYPENDQPLLDNASLHLPAGACLVIRGDSGTGKSTLLKLIAGLLTPDSGQVLHDDRAVPPLSHSTGALAWAGQHPWFVHGTLADNLRLVAPAADNDTLHAVLAQCGLDNLSSGLATPLDENGGGLSGGQGRRLGLARALLSDAPLLLLDEPTAELDPAMEARVLDALRAQIGHRTVVIATHSATCAALANHSLWLNQEADGQISLEVAHV